jgi:sulfopropanediol 3-dehydrogenase
MVTLYLKDAQPQLRQDSRAVSDRVRAMLDDIEQNRDAAVRRYAKDLDRWERPEFRVTDDEIAAARRAMSQTFKDDFAFCKKQVTDFAERQRDSIHEFEAEVGDGITPDKRSSRWKGLVVTSPVASIRSSLQPS